MPVAKYKADKLHMAAAFWVTRINDRGAGTGRGRLAGQAGQPIEQAPK